MGADRKPWWMKVYPYAILSSYRCQQLRYDELGLWFAIMLAGFVSTGKDCELRVGETPWTFDDLAFHLGVDRRRTARLRKHLDKLVDLELVGIKEDGTIYVPRFAELQDNPAAARALIGDVVGRVADKTRPPRTETTDWWGRKDRNRTRRR